MRALITGASGFVGRWLASALVREGWHVVGTATQRPDHAAMSVLTRRREWAAMSDIEWIAGDVRDASHLEAAVQAAKPDAIVSLAAVSSVPEATRDPAMAWDVNVVSTVRLLHIADAVRRAGTIDPTVLVVGSSEQYGRHDEHEMPLTETATQQPRTVYGATKCGQEVAALQASVGRGLRVIGVRPFVHTGPGQEQRFLTPALVARAIALRSAIPGSVLMMGNTTPVRDFLHVADVVDAYISLLRRGEAGQVYNVASGIGRSVRAVAEQVLDAVGVAAEIREDPALVRDVDVPTLVGDAARLRQATGWQPTRTFDQILHDLIDDHERYAATH